METHRERITVLQDAILELEIQLSGKKIELALAIAGSPDYAQGFRNLARAEADQHRRVMERLVKSRSNEQVAKLEQDRGLHHGL